MHNNEHLDFFKRVFPFPPQLELFATFKINIQFTLVNQKLIFFPPCWYVYSLKTFSNLIRIDFFHGILSNLPSLCWVKFDGNKLFVKMQVVFCCTEKISSHCKKYNKWNKTKIADVLIKLVNMCIIEFHWNYCKWSCYIV